MTTAVTTRQEPTKEQYSTGKLRIKMAKQDDSPPGSPTDMPVGKTKGCYVCGEHGGGGFTSLPDENNVGRVIHLPTRAVDGKSVDRNVECLGTFTGRVAAAQRQQVQQEKETLALAALRREGGNIPRLEHSSQRHFDCPAPDCSRFFDTEPGVTLHRRRAHKAD